MPRGSHLIALTMRWGDGTRTTAARLTGLLSHVYARAGHYSATLALSARIRPTRYYKRTRITVRALAELVVRVRKRLTFPVSAGSEIVSLDAAGNPDTGHGTPVRAVMSSDGNHLAWGWTGGLIYRDLQTGVRVEPPATFPYALDMSADGRYVAWSEASKVSPSRYVEAMDVRLWDTRTGQIQTINRRAPKAPADDGSTHELTVSADGSAIAFTSTSQALAPAGEHLCTPVISDCTEDPGYVYLYNRLRRTLTPVPPQRMFGDTPELTDPVISADGGVVVFHDGGDDDVWYTRSGVVRRVDEGDTPCQNPASSLALSADGTTLAENCGGVLSAFLLGGPSGPDRPEWMFGSLDTLALDDSVALSADGSVMAAFGAGGPAGWGLWPVWRVSLPTGAMSLEGAPAPAGGLPAEPKLQSGMADNRVSISADGSAITAATCSLSAPRPAVPSPSEAQFNREQICPLRSDIYRWRR